jgi:hypothetical protein
MSAVLSVKRVKALVLPNVKYDLGHRACIKESSGSEESKISQKLLDQIPGELFGNFCIFLLF